MSLTTEEIRTYIVDNIADSGFERFIDFERLPKVAAQIQKYGLGVMSKTLIARAVQDLGLDRKPLYSNDDAADEAEEAIRKADATPLTRELGNQLTQMIPQQVAEKFYSDPYFQRLYTRAAALWNFKIPPKPTPQVPGTSVVPIALDAKTYHSLPAAVVCRRLKEPAFRAAVEKLISEGLI